MGSAVTGSNDPCLRWPEIRPAPVTLSSHSATFGLHSCADPFGGPFVRTVDTTRRWVCDRSGFTTCAIRLEIGHWCGHGHRRGRELTRPPGLAYPDVAPPQEITKRDNNKHCGRTKSPIVSLVLSERANRPFDPRCSGTSGKCRTSRPRVKYQLGDSTTNGPSRASVVH